MVSVVVTQAFPYLGRNVYPGESIEMEPIDAAVKAHAGMVSLLHGQQYQTRHMEAAEPDQSYVFLPPLDQGKSDPEPPKRRRGRPRKKQG